MQIKLAETAGFCFGVNRAVDLVYELVQNGEKVCTLGPIIHNQQLVDDLAARGVKTIVSPAECEDGYKIVVRTHGVEKSVIDDIENRNIPYVNATCPFVLKIHKIVGKQNDNTVTLIAGDENHPEVRGIRSYCKGKSFVFKNEEELQNIIDCDDFSADNDIICVSQTTFSLEEWKKCKKKLKKVYTNCEIFDTICSA
ncbi:MAG: bifunctional 4-hydroxy-3-methylbut-2-enyl diphosphate reductase/30S ribosomal protein S1, partial [Eubacterium sp.]|nr:bifunctional 4-hydroxy-3-methylbut-2-enyl diphosphate reductase/30S ribosomal protein S1 [Eubacterium sp.]